MPLCIVIADLKTEITAEHVFTGFDYIKSEIEADAYYTKCNDLKTSIAAIIPFADLKTEISARFPVDFVGPYVIPETYPLDEEGGISIYGPIFIVVEDLVSGIDKSSLELIVDSVTYTFDSSEVTFLDINIPYRYVIRYVPSIPWSLDTTVNVSIFIKDKAGNLGMTDLVV